MDNVVLLQIAVVAVAVVCVAVLFSMRAMKRRHEETVARMEADADNRVQQINENAAKELTQKVQESQVAHKTELLQERERIERENKSRVDELQKLEQRINQRDEILDRRRESLDGKEAAVERREADLSVKEQDLKREEARYKQLQEEEIRKLEEISGLSVENAKKELMERFMEEAKQDIAVEVQRLERRARNTVEADAKQALALAVERFSSEHVAENLVSVVDLPTDEMKGRIIGREGRNIRALEMATGVDVIIDDTPEAVVVSGFDKVRRETARLALEALVQDGRIHPGRIEDIVNKTKRDIDSQIRRAGEEAIMELGVGDVHPELVNMLGRLKYRTSYSQNALMHSKEVAYLSGMLADELRIDPTMAKRAGLFHDIGKAATHEVEGSHVQIGYDIAKRYNEPPEVLNAIVSHHEDEEANCIESVLVKAADTLSAARPGARREMVESYIKRLEALEKIAESFKGVEKCFAIQAGREIRVSVQPDEITDSQATFLARDIAKRIESERTYPGEILVTVIRETRHMATAR